MKEEDEDPPLEPAPLIEIPEPARYAKDPAADRLVEDLVAAMKASLLYRARGRRLNALPHSVQSRSGRAS